MRKIKHGYDTVLLDLFALVCMALIVLVVLAVINVAGSRDDDISLDKKIADILTDATHTLQVTGDAIVISFAMAEPNERIAMRYILCGLQGDYLGYDLVLNDVVLEADTWQNIDCIGFAPIEWDVISQTS